MRKWLWSVPTFSWECDGSYLWIALLESHGMGVGTQLCEAVATCCWDRTSGCLRKRSTPASEGIGPALTFGSPPRWMERLTPRFWRLWSSRIFACRFHFKGFPPNKDESIFPRHTQWIEHTLWLAQPSLRFWVSIRHPPQPPDNIQVLGAAQLGKAQLGTECCGAASGLARAGK